MEFITPIASIIAIIVAVFSIPKTLHAINEQKRKKFRDELDFFKEYFEKYYKNDTPELTLLIRDKAAHTLTRSPFINAKLTNYFIELHENQKADFQKLVDSFHFGHKFIDVDDQNLKFKATIKNLKYRKNLYYFLVSLIFFYIFALYGTNAGEYLHIILKSTITIFSVIVCIQLLDKSIDVEEADAFLKIMNQVQNEED